MRHLYQKIYLTIVATLVLVVLIAGALWRLGSPGSPFSQVLEVAGELAGAALPSADAPQAVQQQALDRLAQHVNTDLALFDATLQPIAFTGRPLPPPSGVNESGWVRGPGGPAWSFQLPDRRWVVIRAPRRHRNPVIGLVLFLGVIALAVAVSAFPVVRGLTRRLETLQAGVETLGAGNLSTRVKVRVATRLPGWPKASIAPPAASRNSSPPIGCCSPMPRTSCARPCHAFGSGSS